MKSIAYPLTILAGVMISLLILGAFVGIQDMTVEPDGKPSYQLKTYELPWQTNHFSMTAVGSWNTKTRYLYGFYKSDIGSTGMTSQGHSNCGFVTGRK